MMVGILFGVLIGLVLLRVPLAWAMFIACLAAIVADDKPIMVMAMRTFDGLQAFPLLAVPLFLLAGMLCNATSITDRIMDLTAAMVWRMRAALAQINVVSSMLFAGVSGSSLADTAGTGVIIMPQMVKAGYPVPFTVALQAISSTIGNVIPPSIMMVIYGAFGNVSIGALFLAGIIPGMLIGFGQMILVHYMSKYYGWGENDFKGEKRPRFWKALKRGWAPLGVPVLIVGGIVGGVFTATESAAWVVVYVVLLGVFMRELKPKSTWEMAVETTKTVGLVMIMTSAAAVFGYMLAFYKFPEMTLGLFQAFGITRYGVLLAVVVLYLLLGTALESTPSIIMFLPTIQTLGDAVGIHPVQMGVIVVMCTALGMVTPPHGVCLMVSARIMKVHQKVAFGQVAILGTVSVAVILLAVFIEDVTLLIPRLLMPKFF